MTYKIHFSIIYYLLLGVNMEKECFKCGIVKPIDEFYKHKQMADGHLNKCKECTKLDVFGRTPEDIEKRKHRDRNRTNKAERVIKNRERINSDPEKRKMYNQKRNEWSKRNNSKRLAHGKLSRAVLKGTVKREYNCSKCGSDNKVEAHHEDYSKPLEVVWLCSKCHHARHVEIRNEQRSTNK